MFDDLKPAPIEEQFKIMANSAPVLIWISGADKLCYFFNAGWLNFTGRTLQEEYGNGWAEGVHPEDLERCLNVYNSSFDAKVEFKMEYRLRRHDGRYRWLLDHGVPRFLEDGTFAGFIGTCVDIEDLLQSSRFRHEFVTAEVLRKEQALNEELAASNEELNASNEELSVTIEKLEPTQQQLAELNEELEEKVKARTVELEKSEAEQQVLNEELTAINEELLATNEDLLQSRERLEKLIDDLAASEQKARSIVESAPFPIGVYRGREMRIELLNQAIIDVWGKGGNLIGKTYAEVLPELAGTDIYEQLDRVFTTGIAYHTVNQRVDLNVNGKLAPFYFNYDFTPLFDNNGNVYGVMNTAADVTALVNAKLQVEQSQKNLYNIIMQAPVAMCILVGPNHIVEVANNRIIELWGKPREAVMDRPIFEGVADAKGQGLEALLDEVYNKGATFEARERPVSLLRNGKQETLYLDFVYQPYREPGGNILGVIATAIDVTGQIAARKIVQQLNEELAAANEELTSANEEQSKINQELEALNEALRISQDELQLAIDAAGLGTWDLNPVSGRFVGNERTKAWFALPSDDDIELSKAIEAIAEADRQRVVSAIETALSYESGGEFAVDYTIISQQDAIKRVLRAKGKTLFNEDRQAVRLSGVLQDVTEQKKDEQRKNDFIGIVSHELKTPLTSLKALLQVATLKLKTSEDAFLRGAIEKSNIQVRKMETLINGFLNISRLESGKMKIEKSNFNLQELIGELIRETELTITSHIIDFISSDPIIVLADQDKISSVISNLLSNAVKYSPKGKRVEVQCQVVDNTAQVSVRDEGMGIREEDKEKLFERYYRVETSDTKHISGFGIGLYLSAEIVERHGGRIWVDSKAGQGATFTFTLPLPIAG